MPTFNEDVILGNGFKIGVGTATPKESVHVVGALRVANDGDGVPLLHLDSERGWVFRQHGSGGSTALELTGNRASNNNKNFLIMTEGKVGIGTAAPNVKLHVAGSVVVDDDVILAGADCAEDFEVDTADGCEPGMVMVIGRHRRLVACSRPYDTRVAGIVSGAGDRRPGIVLGRPQGGSTTGRRPIALAGTVNCLVDARVRPIEAGDLLTTAAMPGHAMLAADTSRRIGAIVGKALDDMAEGLGTIPVLVSRH
jgi:hypothetical protein